MTNRLQRCPDCGALTPKVDGPTHPYLGASAGCWAVAGRVLAREYEDYERYAPVHRLGVSAYPAQHPGVPSPRAAASVGMHLIRLHLLLDRALRPENANAAIVWASRRNRDFTWLSPPSSLGELTIIHVLDARDPEEHIRRVGEWARSVWGAWSSHHETIRYWAAS